MVQWLTEIAPHNFKVCLFKFKYIIYKCMLAMLSLFLYILSFLCYSLDAPGPRIGNIPKRASVSERGFADAEVDQLGNLEETKKKLSVKYGGPSDNEDSGGHSALPAIRIGSGHHDHGSGKSDGGSSPLSSHLPKISSGSGKLHSVSSPPAMHTHHENDNEKEDIFDHEPFQHHQRSNDPLSTMPIAEGRNESFSPREMFSSDTIDTGKKKASSFAEQFQWDRCSETESGPLVAAASHDNSDDEHHAGEIAVAAVVISDRKEKVDTDIKADNTAVFAQVENNNVTIGDHYSSSGDVQTDQTQTLASSVGSCTADIIVGLITSESSNGEESSINNNAPIYTDESLIIAESSVSHKEPIVHTFPADALQNGKLLSKEEEELITIG